MRNYRPNRANSNRPEVYRTRTERNVVQQRDAILAMKELSEGEITIQQVASRLDCKKSICSVRLIELVRSGHLEKLPSEGNTFRWKLRRNIIHPLSILWTRKALKVAYAS
jgi:hypothetical protein